MSDPSGWLWVLIAVLGMGGLGLCVAYGNACGAAEVRLHDGCKTQRYGKIIAKRKSEKKTKSA